MEHGVKMEHSELNPQTSYWIDLRHESDTYWIYKQVGNRVFNVLGVSEWDEGTDVLTAITAQQYDAIEEIWNDGRDRNRTVDILAVLQMFTNSKAYLDWVKSEAENKIYEDLAKHGEPENITVTFYGRTLVIDTNADNYESFCSFLSEVVKNDNE